MRVVVDDVAAAFLDIDIGGYGSRLARKRLAGTMAFYHFINRGGVVVKRDDLAI